LSVISAVFFLASLKTGLRSEFDYLDAMSLRLVRIVIDAPCLTGDLAFRAELLDAVADLILAKAIVILYLISGGNVKDNLNQLLFNLFDVNHI